MSSTSVAHLAFISLITVYLTWSYPAAGVALGVQLALAMISEVMHGSWRGSERWVVLREAFFLSGLAIAWLLKAPLYPLVGFALCASLLLLVRHRALRFLPALCAADLVWCGVGGTSLTSAPHSAGAAAAALVPLAVAALATDAWLEAQSGARHGHPGPRNHGHSAPLKVSKLPTWWWLLRPVLVCSVVALAIGLPASHRDPDDIPVQPLRVPNPVVSAQAHGGGLSTMVRIGDQLRIERDQRVCARLEWNGAAPKTGSMVYLRAITMPEVIVEGPFMLWHAAEDGFTPFTASFPARTASGWLLRRRGGGDAVLRPDGARGVALEHLRRDRDGNWYQAGLGRQSATYRVSLETLVDTVTGEATAAEVERSQRLPRSLADLPWRRVERPAWASMTPEDAVRDIVHVIHSRCRYELDSLPAPDPTPGGALLTFLLSDEIDDRRGHCQYFSTAAVVLMRRAGHAARTVVGFASEEIDAKGVTFRGMHAHAWLEIVDSRGRWQRVDATPAAGYLQRLAGFDVTLAETPPAVVTGQTPTDDSATHDPAEMLEPMPGVRVSRSWAYGGGILALVMAIGYASYRWLMGRPSAHVRQRQALAHATETLFACARELGVPVRPSSTLAEVTAAVSRRTGIDLSGYLHEHQAARFGFGPPPRPWPLEALRAAARTRYVAG